MTNVQGSQSADHRLPVSVRLRPLFPDARFVNCDDLRVRDITERSGECTHHGTFAVISGAKHDGARFIPDAVAHGATSLLAERPQSDFPGPQCLVSDVREAYARICAALSGNPSQAMRVVGVTGTNGKTTVTWLIRAMLRRAGHRCGLLGTIEYDDGYRAEASSLTTPDSNTFHRFLSRMASRETRYAAVEMSSHALHQGRIAGTQLAAAVVTNITRDHFDYHQTFDHYQTAKARILELLPAGGIAVLNRDDPGSWGLSDRVASSREFIDFSLREHAAVTGRLISEGLSGTRFRLTIGEDSVVCDSPLVGRHNLENCLAAAAVCSRFGVSLAEMSAVIREFTGAPGRLERIACGQRFEVFVDYAHTDDALRRCVQALRSITPGRLICVFGAGGDRDRTKRPLLGRAAQFADVPIVTSDNPRSEPPDQIVAEILQGCSPEGAQPLVELDRARAIRLAVRLAQPGDSVLIAGKGHEAEQIFRNHRIVFDDRREARHAILEHLADDITSRRIGA